MRVKAARKPRSGRKQDRPHDVALQLFCRAVGLPSPVPEHRFDPDRRWRFDWAWPEQKIALEQEGGIWIQGRHSRGAGMVKDFEKYNRAAVLGWRVLKATPQQVASGEIIETLQAVFG